jgi:hypothetical protein
MTLKISTIEILLNSQIHVIENSLETIQIHMGHINQALGSLKNIEEEMRVIRPQKKTKRVKLEKE